MRLAYHLFITRVVLSGNRGEIVWRMVPLFPVMELFLDAQHLENGDVSEYLLPSHEDQLTVSIKGQTVQLSSQVCGQTLTVGLEEFRAAIPPFIRDADMQIRNRINRQADMHLLAELDQFAS